MKIRIFTDGACSGNPGPGGWAALIALKDKHIKISGHEEETTNNRMELKSVVAALRYVFLNVDRLNEKLEFHEVEIISDSAYVVNSINQNWIESWEKNCWKTRRNENVKNVDLWKKIKVFKAKLEEECIKLTFTKVKGHSGDPFNELVDSIARDEIKKIK